MECKASPFRRQCFGLKRIWLRNALEKNLPNGLCIIPHPPLLSTAWESLQKNVLRQIKRKYSLHTFDALQIGAQRFGFFVKPFVQLIFQNYYYLQIFFLFHEHEIYFQRRYVLLKRVIFHCNLSGVWEFDDVEETVGN